MNIEIINYSERSIAVVGDTKAIKDQLKELGGRFNFKLSCGAGWIFPKSKQADVEAFINGGVVVSTKAVATPKATENEPFKKWLKEYADTTTDKDYYLKYYVGAVKLGDKYFLLKKPPLKTRFCFHDEGVQDVFHRELLSADEKMRNYFLSENLEEFSIDIKNIKNHGKVFISMDCGGEKCRCYTREYDWQTAYRDEDIEATNEQTTIILDGLEFALSLLEKRCNAYLKRFGISKIGTWSFWADR